MRRWACGVVIVSSSVDKVVDRYKERVCESEAVRMTMTMTMTRRETETKTKTVTVTVT